MTISLKKKNDQTGLVDVGGGSGNRQQGIS
jgi:hypothetical protein